MDNTNREQFIIAPLSPTVCQRAAWPDQILLYNGGGKQEGGGGGVKGWEREGCWEGKERGLMRF